MARRSSRAGSPLAIRWSCSAPDLPHHVLERPVRGLRRRAVPRYLPQSAVVEVVMPAVDAQPRVPVRGLDPEVAPVAREQLVARGHAAGLLALGHLVEAEVPHPAGGAGPA